jgi:replication factor C subunit 1
MFTTKYRPTKLSDFVGNSKAVQPFIKWLLTWEPSSKKNRCLLVSGVNGLGKSLLVHLILKKHSYHAIHLTPDEDRSKETIQASIKPLLHVKKTFDNCENVLVVSDVDSTSGDHGFISALVDCIKETEIPIICICDDRFSQNLKPLLTHCLDIKMTKPTYTDVYAFIYKVVTAENMKIKKSVVDKLIDQANGDIRFILNTLQLGVKNVSTNKDLQSANIFDTAGTLLNMDVPFASKYTTYWLAHDIHTLLIQENYIGCIIGAKETEKAAQDKKYFPKNLDYLAEAADALSDADLLDTEFNFELSPYVAANTIHATLKCNKKGLIKFPRFLGKISVQNKNKREKLDYDKIKFAGV